MKVLLPALILAATSLVAFAEEGITLQNAYLSAIQKTEGVSIEEAQFSVAEAKVAYARSDFYPQLDFKWGYQKGNSASSYYAVSSGKSTTLFTASQSIFEGGGRFATLNAARFSRDSQGYRVEAARVVLYAQVAQAYYDVLSKEQEVATLHTLLSLNADRAKEIAKMTKIGRAKEIDLLAAQAQEAVVEAQHFEALGNLEVARDHFSLVTGIESHTNLIDRADSFPPLQELQAYLGQNEQTPQIKSLTALRDSASASVWTARSSHLPTFALEGNYYVTGPDRSQTNYWNLGVTLTIPIFHGLAVKSKVDEAVGAEAVADRNLEKERREGQAQIKTAYHQYQSALAQLKILENALRVAERSYKEHEKDFHFGRATNLDVIQALNTFHDTKRTLDRTRFNAKIAWANLAAATGVLPKL